MIEYFLLTGELLLLSFNYLLLLIHGVEQNHGDAVVLHAFDQALRVVADEQRFDLFDILRAQSDIPHSAVAPIKSNRAQATNDLQTTGECQYIGFIAEA